MVILVELIETLVNADLAEIQEILDDLYAPVCAGIVFVGAILPPCGLISAAVALIRALGGGSRA